MALSQVPGRGRLRAISGLIGAIALLAVSACTSDGGASTKARADAALPPVEAAAPACPVVEDTSAGAVSFEHDVLPFFSVTCAFGGCHDGKSRLAGLYLGPNFTDGAPDAQTRADVHASLLSPATTTPDLPRVTAGDPAKSFILLKLQGCQNDVGLTCTGPVPGQPCGARMPAISDAVPAASRQLIARWIAAGAAND